jgi:uncharacterized protein (TIGR03435 family)
VLTLAATIARAQPVARPKFDVAGIKPTTGQRMAVRPMPGGPLTVALPLKLLIMNACGFRRPQILGGPNRMNSGRCAIDAKAPATRLASSSC